MGSTAVPAVDFGVPPESVILCPLVWRLSSRSARCARNVPGGTPATTAGTAVLPI